MERAFVRSCENATAPRAMSKQHGKNRRIFHLLLMEGHSRWNVVGMSTAEPDFSAGRLTRRIRAHSDHSENLASPSRTCISSFGASPLFQSEVRDLTR